MVACRRAIAGATRNDTVLFHCRRRRAGLLSTGFRCGEWIKGEWTDGGTARTEESEMRWIGDMHKTVSAGLLFVQR